MSIKFTVEHDVELESYVLKCADEVIILRSETFDEAIMEAQDIAEEWA